MNSIFGLSSIYNIIDRVFEFAVHLHLNILPKFFDRGNCQCLIFDVSFY